MLTKKLKILIIALVGMMFSLPAFATDEPFIASITILSPLAIVETSPLTFPTTASSTVTQAVVVAPTAAGAASFNITGTASTAITASIVEANLSMVNGGTTIVVDTFTFGGGLAASGTATLSTTGSVTGAAVGATANIPANPAAGAYSGNLTFRVVYQ